MSNQITNIANRQHQSLTEADWLSLKRALHDYIIEEDLNVDDLQSNMDLADEILPRIAKYNPDWDGVKSISDLKNSKILQSFMTNLKNQFRNKGQTLKGKITIEKKLRSDGTASLDPDQGNQQQVSSKANEDSNNVSPSKDKI